MNVKWAIVAAIGVLPTTASAIESCGASLSCSPIEYPVYSFKAICPPKGQGNLPAEKTCRNLEHAPGAWIQCSRTFTGFSCRGWNRGDATDPFGYQWSVSPPLVLQSPANAIDASIKCGTTLRGGTITLVVTSPVGLQSSTSISVSCDTRIEQ